MDKDLVNQVVFLHERIAYLENDLCLVNEVYRRSDLRFVRYDEKEKREVVIDTPVLSEILTKVRENIITLALQKLEEYKKELKSL